MNNQSTSAQADIVSRNYPEEVSEFAPPSDCQLFKKRIHECCASSFSETFAIIDPNNARPEKIYEDSESEEEMTRETVIIDDERVLVTPTTSQPYKWVCSLRMQFSNGKRYVGTGFFCTVTGYKRMAILTCAHNLYHSKRGGYVKEVEVIPGRDGYRSPLGSFKVTNPYIRVPDGYKTSPTPKDDYGVVFLDKPIDTPYGFGYKILSDSDLNGRIVQTVGYPGDKTNGTLWLAGGKISYTKPYRIFYINDTAGGQSGSPVWTWEKWNWIVIGVHGYGGVTRNSARRITRDMVSQINSWAAEFD